MPARRWIRAFAAAAFLLALGAGAAGAASGDLTTTVTTSATTTTTEPTTTTLATTTTVATTTTAATTTAPAATTATTTAPTAATTAPAPRPAVAPCPRLGALAVLRPHRRALELATGGRYPTDGGIVRAEFAAADGSCGVSLRDLSLFGGAIEVDSASIRIRNGSAVPTIAGVRVGGRTVAPRRDSVVPVGAWALLEPLPVLVCPSTGRQQGALAVHLLKARAGLPAGATLLIAFADVPSGSGSPVPALCAGVHKRQLDRNERLHLPLTVTPPLGQHLRYVFPVAANVGVFDTYGAARSDVPGGWHHGDDIFVAIGTPVVAVADGTLNRVGWNKTGGWRLWVRDNVGDQFYYAHLSGYTPLALEQGSVRAGDVLGFVGDSGDAIMTPPHLHFEVHPRSLLFLKYDGAVDPTSYLQSWPHVAVSEAPRPVVPRLPRGPARAEAAKLYRRLLVIRGYHPKPRPAPAAQPVAAAPAESATKPPRRAAPVRAASSSTSGWLFAGPIGGALLLAAAAAAYVRRRRPAVSPVAVVEPEPPRPVLPAAAAARRGTTTHALVRIGIVLLASSAAMRAARTQGARETA